ncbi:MAG: hypothetical protein LC676_10840 [Loktanella sp.]|nr:hypothetical protein [Loktanella sp.]
MIDAFAIDLDPPALIVPARKGRGRDRGRGRGRDDYRPRRDWTIFAIGTVLILSDGRECVVVSAPPAEAICEDDRGNLWLLPD